MGSDLLRGAFFNKFAMFKDGDLVADVLHNSEIVGDKKIGQVQFFLEIHQKIHDLSLDGNVQGTDGFIADNEFRFNGKGTGDTDPLALSPAELVGKASGVGGVESDESQEFRYPFGSVGSGHLGEVNFQRFGKDGADPEPGIQGVVRILKNHLNLFAIGAKRRAGKGANLFSLVGDGAGGGVDESDDDSSHCGFSRAAFSDQTECGAFFNFERNVIERLYDTGGTLEETRPNRKMNG